MAVKSIICPNCGASGIQIDTAREHSYCSYCGSTLKTKDVLHLDIESMTLAKLRRNAEKSFEVRQYENARSDWEKVTQLDRTDHESYFGVVRCNMAMQPYQVIDKTGFFGQALAYAPPDVQAEYIRQVERFNTRARAAKAILDAQRKEILAKHQAMQRFISRMRTLQSVTKWIFIMIGPFAFLSVLAGHSSWPVLLALTLAAIATYFYAAIKIKIRKG